MIEIKPMSRRPRIKFVTVEDCCKFIIARFFRRPRFIEHFKKVL